MNGRRALAGLPKNSSAALRNRRVAGMPMFGCHLDPEKYVK